MGQLALASSFDRAVFFGMPVGRAVQWVAAAGGRIGSRPRAKGGSKAGIELPDVMAYAELIIDVTVLKVALICEPSPRAAAMMPTAIKAAMRPYSMAVAPDSSFTKRMTWFCMTDSPVLLAVWRVLPRVVRLRGHAFEGAKAAENPDRYLTAR